MTLEYLDDFFQQQRLHFTRRDLRDGACHWQVILSPLLRRFTQKSHLVFLPQGFSATLGGGAEELLEYLIAEVDPDLSSLFVVIGELEHDSPLGLSTYSDTWFTLERAQLTRFRSSKQQKAVFRRWFLDNVPLTALSPYQTNYHVSQEMFFGRRSLLRDIRAQRGKSFALLGPRRVGKSSLAKAIQRMRQGEAGKRIQIDKYRYANPAAYVDCNLLSNISDPEDAFFRAAVDSMGIEARDQYLGRRLWGRRITDLEPFEFFQRLLTHKYSGITLIIDELDALVPHQRKRNWSLFRKIQGLLDQLSKAEEPPSLAPLERPTVVLVGFTKLRDALYDPDFPFHGRVDSLTVGNLGRAPIAHLVTDPLRELGIRFSDAADILRRITHHTGGNPSIVQSLCDEAVQHMERLNIRTITSTMVEEIVASESPLKAYVSYFDYLAKPLERLLVYYAAPRKRFRTKAFQSHAKEKGWPRPPADVLARALDDLKLANIFQEIRRHTEYSFSVEAFRAVIEQRRSEEEDLPALLQELGER